MNTYQQQCLLGYLGYDPGPIDGLDGPRTKAALERFREDYGMGAEGLIAAIAGTAAKVERPAESEPAATDKPKTGTFWDDIRYFTREEFRCKCGGQYCNGYPAEMQEAVVKIADAAREHFGKPAHVVSGLRCKTWNGMQGGVPNSQHMYGEACDLCVDGVGWSDLLAYIKTIPGVRYAYHIEGSNNVHFDINKVGR